MTKPQILREGMREGDLADLVLPLISVDEYASKIDEDEAIVVGFYVHDESAARDLNRFLQKSAVPILGTDVSPAPDQHGYFMVFVEMMNNDRLAENLDSILQEISALVDIEEWQLRIRSTDHVLPYSEETLLRGLKQAARTAKKKQVVEYLQNSDLLNAEFQDGLLILEAFTERFCFDFVEFDQLNALMRDYRLDETAMKYDMRSIAKTNKIARMLGEEWEAAQIGRFILLNHITDPRGLLLKL